MDTKKWSIFLLIALAAILVVFLLLRRNANLSRPPLPLAPEAKPPAQTIVGRSGSIKIATATGEAQIALANKLTVNLVASSEGKTIVGYDLILAYDPSIFDYVGAQSNLTDFRIFTFKSPGQVVVTGIKDIKSQKIKRIFNQTNLVSLTFTPKQRGRGTFSVLTVSGKEKTQLVDDGSNVLNPMTDKLEISVN